MTGDDAADRPEIGGAELDVGGLVEDALAVTAAAARARGVAVAERVAPEVVRRRAGSLRQVLIDVLDDAIARTVNGTVTVRVDAAPGDEVLLAVVGGGPGEDGRTVEPDVTASRQQAAALGGRLWVEPASNGGRAVVIAVPLRPAGASAELEPPIDHDTLLARVGGDRRLAADLAAIFVAHHLEVVAPVRAAVASGDPVAISRAAHGARGAVAMICAARAMALCAAIEARAINPAACAPLVDRLDREVRRAAADLASHAASNT